MKRKFSLSTVLVSMLCLTFVLTTAFADYSPSNLPATASSTATMVHYKDTFPKIAGMYIGGPRHYEDAPVQANLAKHDLVILGFWRGWKHDGKTIQQIVQEIKSLNPDMLIGQYTNLVETYTNTDSNDATYDLKVKLDSEIGPNGIGDWWARDSNGNLVSSYPRTAGINLTKFVTPDANGDRYPQWLAKRNDTVFFNSAPEFDIWYSDNAFYKPRTTADWNRDGINDSKNDPAVQAYYREGVASYWDAAMQLEPNMLVMGNVDGDAAGHGYLRDPEYKNKLPGAFMESAMGKSFSLETWAGWDAMMVDYQSLMDNTTDPHLVVFNAKADADDYAMVRYGLTSALMEDGYYSFNSNSGSYSDSHITWYDEFDVDLGKAIDAPQRTPWQNGVYMRKFDKGIALVNPKGNGTQTVTLPAGYRHFVGTQDPTVNNGEKVSTITLNERDGVILVRAND